jgi:hypothetical protein
MNSFSVVALRRLHSTASVLFDLSSFMRMIQLEVKIHIVVRTGLELGDILLSTHDHEILTDEMISPQHMFT